MTYHRRLGALSRTKGCVGARPTRPHNAMRRAGPLAAARRRGRQHTMVETALARSRRRVSSPAATPVTVREHQNLRVVHRAAVAQVDVPDPLLTDTTAHRRVHAELVDMTRLAVARDVPPATHERHLDNDATRRWMAISDYMAEWTATIIPSAAALQAPQDPTPGTALPSGTVLDDHTSQYFRYAHDAIAVRSRAKVMHDVMTAHFQDASHDLAWLSLACGTALPTFQASQTVRTTAEVDISLTLADWDRQALRAAEATARRMEIDHVHAVEADITVADGLHSLGTASFDAIDILGFFEYLRARPGRTSRLTAASFLGLSYRLLRPGGVLVFANMLDSHPHLDFHRRVMQWPLIQPRSLGDIMLLIDQAGIPRDHIRIYLPSDGANAVVSVRKPQRRPQLR